MKRVCELLTERLLMVYLNYPTGNLNRRANVQLLYNNSKVQKQCTDLKTAKKLFGGNAALATSLFARINAMQQASVIKDIVMMQTFHFHKLSGNMNGFFCYRRINEERSMAYYYSTIR